MKRLWLIDSLDSTSVSFTSEGHSMRLIQTLLSHVVPPLVGISLAMPLTLPASAQSFAVRQVRVFDGDRLHPEMTVVVRDGLIQSVQADTVVPPGLEVIGEPGAANLAAHPGIGRYLSGEHIKNLIRYNPRRGRIAAGLRVDLLLVDGDPTADILATRNIAATWKQGVRFDREAYRSAVQAERNR